MRNIRFLGTMLNNKRYNDDFRRKVAILAAETSNVKAVAEITGVSVGSIYRWMKAYDTFRQYILKKYKRNELNQTCFVKKSRYSNEFRRIVANDAIKTNADYAAKIYGVSRGSVDNWIKAFQGNHVYLNR